MVDRCLFRWGLEDIIKIKLFFSLPEKFSFSLLSLLPIPFNKKALKGKNIQQNQTLSQCFCPLTDSPGTSCLMKRKGRKLPFWTFFFLIIQCLIGSRKNKILGFYKFHVPSFLCVECLFFSFRAGVISQFLGSCIITSTDVHFE